MSIGYTWLRLEQKAKCFINLILETAVQEAPPEGCLAPSAQITGAGGLCFDFMPGPNNNYMN